MSNSNNENFLVLLIPIAQIGGWLWSGFKAWDWVEPDSFLSAIGFLIVWHLLAGFIYMLMAGVAMLFAANS